MRYVLVGMAIGFAGMSAAADRATAAVQGGSRYANDASRIIGGVVDIASDEPIEGATVRLEGAGETRLTDEDGRFTLDGVPLGRYRLEVAFLGFGMAADSIHVDEPGRTYTVEVRLSTEPIDVDPIVVEILPHAGTILTDVERRIEHMEKLGLGQFLRRERIEAYGGMRVSHLLQTLPGVWLDGTVPIVARIPRGDGRPCPPQIYVDGLQMRGASSPDRFVTTSDVEAIEVYRGPAQIPLEFGAGDGACGVIAVWTRRGIDDGSPFGWTRAIAGAAGAALVWLVAASFVN